MIDRRRLLKTLAALAGAAVLPVACKHWPEGENPGRGQYEGGNGGNGGNGGGGGGGGGGAGDNY